jgi:hypothetical protein
MVGVAVFKPPRSSNKGQIRIGSRKDGQAPKIAKLPYKLLKYGLW